MFYNDKQSQLINIFLANAIIKITINIIYTFYPSKKNLNNTFSL